MTQVLQVDETKRELGALLGLGGLVPQQSFRLGYAPADHGWFGRGRTPRRAVDEVVE